MGKYKKFNIWFLAIISLFLFNNSVNAESIFNNDYADVSSRMCTSYYDGGSLSCGSYTAPKVNYYDGGLFLRQIVINSLTCNIGSSTTYGECMSKDKPYYAYITYITNFYHESFQNDFGLGAFNVTANAVYGNNMGTTSISIANVKYASMVNIMNSGSFTKGFTIVIEFNMPKSSNADLYGYVGVNFTIAYNNQYYGFSSGSFNYGLVSYDIRDDFNQDLVISSQNEMIISQNTTQISQNNTIINQQNETNNKLDSVNSSINKTNDTLKDSNSDGATNEAGNFFSGFETDTFGLTSIITAPLNLIESITSSTCVPMGLPIPFIEGQTLNLPCLRGIYENHFGVFYDIYKTITFGIVAYWVCVKLFNLVKDFKNPEHDEIEVLEL